MKIIVFGANRKSGKEDAVNIAIVAWREIFVKCSIYQIGQKENKRKIK